MTSQRVSRMTLIVLAFVGLLPVGCGRPTAAQKSDMNAVVNAGANLVQAAAWSGSVTVNRSASDKKTQSDVIHSSTSSQSVVISATITLNNGVATATVKYSALDTVETLDNYDQHTVQGTVSESTEAAGVSNAARVNVAIYDDGRFEIEYGASGVTGLYTKTEVSTTTCKPKAFSCNPSSSKNSDTAQPANLGGVGGSIRGRIDPRNPNALAGSLTEPVSMLSEGSPGRSSVSWTLKR